jgi:hypothetical protein
MAIGNRIPTKLKLGGRFCWNCYNFEDRRDIDGVVLCAGGHTPGICCEDFIARDENLREVDTMEIKLNGWFCWNCGNFEDRRGIDGVLLCARDHSPEGGCEDFIDRDKKLRDIANNNRHERVIVKAVLMENKNPMNYAGNLKKHDIKSKKPKRIQVKKTERANYDKGLCHGKGRCK